MPKEQIRKRGKRKTKNQEEEFAPARPAPIASQPVEHTEVPRQQEAGPSSAPAGIHPARAALLAGRRVPPSEITPSQPVEDEQVLEWSRTQAVDAEYPFGVLDPDLKAYFRNVDDQIRDWEGVSSVGEEREDRQLFLTSVLGELRGHELTVSTDPDTAVVLERLMPSLGDWGRRVIGDAIGDSWETLIRHRFGSHVVQTWFTLAADTLDREAKGIYPPQHQEQAKSAEVGTLPTITNLFEKIISLLAPSLPTLLTNPHASPPIRLLLVVLTPSRTVPTLDNGEADLIRSKKSGKYRKGQAVKGKSILLEGEDEEKSKGKGTARRVPDTLIELRKETVQKLLAVIRPVEWRSMGVSGVGSAAVQLLLELEAGEGDSGKTGSLLDLLVDEMVKHNNEQTSYEVKPNDYVSTLLSSLVGTRLLEVILAVSPLEIFNKIWSSYFIGKIGKLAGHPYANFVVAKGVSRLDIEGIEVVVKECKAVGGAKSLIKTARTSVLQALVDRVKTISQGQKSVLALIQSALDLPDKEKKQLVPCLMCLKTYPTYQALKTGQTPGEEDEPEVVEGAFDPEAEEAAAAAARLEGWRNRRNPKVKDNDLGPNMQGCLLLQGLVGLQGGNEIVLESVLAQDVNMLLEYASSPIASHLLDAILTSPAVSPKYRRKLVGAFLGHYRQLAEDRMGSRVADTIWAKADGFMKEKVARSLIGDANALASSQYGRFLAGKLDLHLLERRPDEWRLKHLGVTGGKALPVATRGAARNDAAAEDEKKRPREKDAIDELFAGVDVKAKKSKKTV